MVRLAVQLSICLGLLCCPNLSASAQDVQEKFELAYGDGVHHFFSNQYPQAYAAFSRAIETGYRDPRPFYFRGLVAEMTARDGKPDFQVAATLEFQGGGSTRLVNAALERIQGPIRTSLETVRREVRRQAASADPYNGLVIIDLKTGKPVGEPGDGSAPQSTAPNSKPLVPPGQEQTNPGRVDLPQ